MDDDEKLPEGGITMFYPDWGGSEAYLLWGSNLLHSLQLLYTIFVYNGNG